PSRDRLVQAGDEASDCSDPSRERVAKRVPPIRSLPSSPGPCPSEYKDPWTWHQARWSVAEASPPRQISGFGNRRPQVCNKPPRSPDSALALSEIPRSPREFWNEKG